MRAPPNNVVASTRELRNVRDDTAGVTPVARKLWLMPGAELGKLRAQGPAYSVRARKPLSMMLVSYGAG
jgi:hypothetical protein